MGSPSENARRVCMMLLEEVERAPAPAFFLPRVAEVLSSEGVSWSAFEPLLSPEARAKVAGRCLPRLAYQAFFPIGGGQVYPGPHTVTAHDAPDLDTAVASFWGWVDAFAARVAEGPHYWNLPGRRPCAAIRRLFGADLLHLATHETHIEEGTVSLRDFCNPEEVVRADEVRILSVVDHHRAAMQTAMVPSVLIADVQSCNTLIAEQQQMLNRRALWVAPERLRLEKVHLLHAILDDTDLLSRVTPRDIFAVGDLLGVDLGDLPQDETFTVQAARLLLERDDLYALYSESCAHREKELAADIEACAADLFADTKVQKGCARVGQTKIFSSNHPLLSEHVGTLRDRWLAAARQAHSERDHLALHVHMVTTIASADEVRSGSRVEGDHRDELWVWAAPGARERLANFLQGLSTSSVPFLEVEFFGDGPHPFEDLFASHFSDAKIIRSGGTTSPMAVVRFPASRLTSRKKSITPHIS